MIKRILCTTALLLLLISSVSFAQSDHMEKAKQPPMKMASTDVIADGIQATFMVMPNESHKKMLKNMKMKEEVEPGSTHNVMIILKDVKTGKEFKNLPATIKIIDEDDNEQIKSSSFMDMMRTYDAYFSLERKKKYQIIILFETQGQKKSIGILYELT